MTEERPEKPEVKHHQKKGFDGGDKSTVGTRKRDKLPAGSEPNVLVKMTVGDKKG